MKKEMKIFELEEKYWTFQKNINLYEYIIPLNLSEEKRNFILNLKAGKKYNPIFKYKKIKLRKNYLSNLSYLEDEFKKYSSPISLLYLKLIRDDKEWINNLYKRDTPEFCEWLSELYGCPNYSLYNKALTTLKLIKLEDLTGREISSDEMKKIIFSKLREKHFDDWKIKVKNSSARISIDSVAKAITIKDDSVFNSLEIDRIIVHEVETHVLRYENGSRQKYLMFRKGFPNYLKTEEGLAILAESKNRVLLNRDLAKYCARLIASYICFKMDFSEMFSFINQYLNTSDSFDVVARIKRGLKDTTHYRGFTKDQIYYSSFLQLKNLSKKKIQKLFVGKIGIEHLNIIDEIEGINYNIELPGWIN